MQRDLANAGYYVCALGALIAALVVASAATVKSVADAPLFGWVTAILEPEAASETRLSQALFNSEEIRAALAKPVAPPARLPPITASVAIGHLLPGSKHAAHATRPRLSSEALNAMAMGVPQTTRAYAPPDQHRVY
jgi:hypothetical protein